MFIARNIKMLVESNLSQKEVSENEPISCLKAKSYLTFNIYLLSCLAVISLLSAFLFLFLEAKLTQWKFAGLFCYRLFLKSRLCSKDIPYMSIICPDWHLLALKTVILVLKKDHHLPWVKDKKKNKVIRHDVCFASYVYKVLWEQKWKNQLISVTL